MKDEIKIVSNSLYISYSYLKRKYDVSENVLKKWNTRSVGKRIIIQNTTYISYETIPSRTKKKLPSKDDLIALMKASKYDEVTDRFFIQLERAYLNGFSQYREIYKELGYDNEKVIEYSRHHAVWAEILKIHGEKKRQPLRNLWEAYNRLYPGKYAYNRMNPSINTCKKEGIKRLLVHNYNTPSKRYDDVYTYWIAEMLRSGKKYSRVYIHKVVCSLARESGRKEISLTTVKNRITELMPVLYSDRYGSDKYNYGNLPYTTMEKASESNLQWQIDGWDLPFYMEGFRKLTLFWVLDSCSGKIVGYQIAPRENTETILTGLENAVENTGVLPLEIVSDNHSFNRTAEADYFKEALDKKAGTTWTTSSNPRFKSLVERSFKSFGEQYCKDMPGYLGEGVLTKNVDGRTSQELMDKYQKAGNWLTEEQIKMIAVKCIAEYNEAKGKDGLTRNERYEAKKGVSAIEIDLIDRLRLFTRTAPYKVTRGQINITREKVEYEFQLRASLYNEWNGKKVNVRYVTFDEIYLFDIKTDRYIGAVPRKQTIHGALADQTDEDKEKLFKHKGRLNGIKTYNKRTYEDIAKSAYSQDKDAAYSINKMLQPKDLIKEFVQNGDLRRDLERQGVDLDNVPSFPKVKEVKTYDPETANKKVNKQKESPFLATEKEIREFDINKYLDEE